MKTAVNLIKLPLPPDECFFYDICIVYVASVKAECLSPAPPEERLAELRMKHCFVGWECASPTALPPSVPIRLIL
ncbi:hypothetical protein CH063_11702 [Colletotrichum higginsianum]|uniref:Uncharacterized protein n=1 Tax=Colletotrichum higginsianum (strain IMI 349063) TaxID=759273 RepID=H1VMH7_COLHI|nr:hypothetical protein CH063_11702 [Colletotrichum higginsianum]